MTGLFLNNSELYDLTHRKRKDTQIAALRLMGIEHRIRPDGSVAVLRKHIEKELGAGGVDANISIPAPEPNWDALNA